MCALRAVRRRDRVAMTTPTQSREEIAIGELDQRYASLRLASPQELSRLRSSVERIGVLSPVLVTTAVEAGRLVLVDGFKRVRVVTDRGGQDGPRGSRP